MQKFSVFFRQDFVLSCYSSSVKGGKWCCGAAQFVTVISQLYFFTTLGRIRAYEKARKVFRLMHSTRHPNRKRNASILAIPEPVWTGSVRVSAAVVVRQEVEWHGWLVLSVNECSVTLNLRTTSVTPHIAAAESLRHPTAICQCSRLNHYTGSCHSVVCRITICTMAV